MVLNNAPKCARDGCDCVAAFNRYYPHSEGGQFWTLCEECFRMFDGDEYDELRVVEDYNNSGNTAEENQAAMDEMFAAMAVSGRNWRENIAEMTPAEVLALRQRQEAIGAGLVAPGCNEESDDEETEVELFEFEGTTYLKDDNDNIYKYLPSQSARGENVEEVGKWDKENECIVFNVAFNERR